jgi:P-type Cu+ transporter
VDTVVFDKTGTLTEGKPIVTEFIVVSETLTTDVHSKGELGDTNMPDLYLLWMLGCVERTSQHPLAHAIVKFVEDKLGPSYLRDNPFEQPTSFRAVTGRGAMGVVNGQTLAVGNRSFADLNNFIIPSSFENRVEELESQGKTAVFVSVDDRVEAILGLSDEIKTDSAASIRYLREVLNVDVWMISGDNERAAIAVGRSLGIDASCILAEAMPASKMQKIQELQDQGRSVVMVGDGLNDAPALSTCLGISMGAGSEIATEASDIVLVKGRVWDVCTALHFGRVVVRRIKWNFVWALLYNCLAIPIAAGVFYPLTRTRLPPTVAAIAMTMSSVSVVLSSLSLQLYRPPAVDNTALTSPGTSQHLDSVDRSRQTELSEPLLSKGHECS